MDSGWRLGHRPSLDGLRGVAVLLVILGHVDNPLVGGAGAYVGVGMFFSLSGFLITALLLDEWASLGKVNLAAFYMRRARRLLPAFAVFAVVCLATGVVAVIALPAVALYVANWAWIQGVDLGAMAHTWSLGVEEQFYLLWPSVLAIALIRGLRAAWWTSIIGVLASAALFLIVVGDEASARRTMAGSDSWVPSLLLGAAIAIATHRAGRIPWSASIVASVGAGILVVLVVTPLTRLSVPLVALAATPVIAWAAANPMALSWRWLTGTGRISYAMYLWHYPFAYGFWPVTRGLPWPLALLVVTAITYTLAAASWLVVERRFLRAYRRGSESQRLAAG